MDTDQWCETLKAVGMKTVVMTFKHHDGYVLWGGEVLPDEA